MKILLFRRPLPAEALKDIAPDKAPKLGFGETSAGGVRWVTIRPPGAETGHPVKLQVDPHNPRIGHVVGGAGGKLNFLKIHLKSPEEYRAQARERAAQKRAKAAEARAAAKKKTDEPGADAVKTRQQAIKVREDELLKAHGDAYERVAKALGWTDLEPPPEALHGLDEATQAKVRKEHAARLHKDVHAAVEHAKGLLRENSEAREKVGVTEFSAKASPDRPAVEDLVGMDSLRRGLGYAPERANLDDAEVHAEKVRVLERRFADEKSSGNAQGAALLAQRLASHRPISADEIDQAGPEALAGFARAALGRLDTLREHAAVAPGDAPPTQEALGALAELESAAPTMADALENAAVPSSGKALKETLKQAAAAGLLDPKAHQQREADLEAARFDSVGAPAPDALAPDQIDSLNNEQLAVLTAEAAQRARTTPEAPEDLRKDAAAVPAPGRKKGGDPKDRRTIDLEDEIEAKRKRDNLGEDAVAVGGMDAETQRDFLRRAIDAGLVGGGEKKPEKPAAPRRQTAVQDPETAAKLVLAGRAIQDLRKQRMDLSHAKNAGKPIPGVDPDAHPAWKSEKDGVLDLKYDNALASPEVVAQVENDIRTARAQSFLGAISEANDAFAEQGGFRPDEAHAELARHVAFGAADALNQHALDILGQPAIDRQVLDTLGAAAAAQVVAWAAHQDRPQDVEAIAEAVGQHHAKTQMQVADEAHQAGVEHAAQAHEIHQHLQTAKGDLRTMAALNEQRIRHYDEARKGMGRALGQLEATAALHSALSGPPPKEIRAAMGTQDAVSVAKSARALGLAPEDFEVQTEGANSWLRLKESAFPKLRKPADDEGAKLDADMLAIKRGDKDEKGWLPAGMTRRADPPARDVPAPKMHSEPFDYSLAKRGSVDEAMRTYVAQRVHDGMSASSIHEDLLHGGHQQALTQAHDDTPAAPSPGGGGADMEQWHGENPEPDRHSFDMFDPGAPERTWQAWDQRRQEAERGSAAPAPRGEGQAAAPLGKDEAARQWGAAMDSIMPSRHYDPRVEREARADAEQLAQGDPAVAATLQKKYGADSPEALQNAIEERATGSVGRRMAEGMAAEVKAVAGAHAEGARSKAGMLHHQELDDEAARDATFRALAAHPAASIAFKDPTTLASHEQRALREAFARYHGVRDEDRQASAQAVKDWHAKNAEPERKVAGLFGEEDNPAHASWTAERDRQHAEAGANDGATWEDYARAHRGPQAAYAAVQDEVKGRFLAEFKAHHEALTGKPVKAGTTPIAGWREHSHALNPEWREASRKDQAEATAAEQSRNRDQGGRYGRGALTEAVEKRLEAEAATKQQNATLALSGGPPGAPKANAAPKGHERVTLGDQAEAQIARHVADFAPMIDPRQAFAARSSLRMDGDKVNQQRAVKAWTRAGKLGLFLGAGSGKTGVSFGAFGELRAQGRAERGLFAVPSNVQGQFGTEALSFLEPGSTKWWAKPGAPKDERMAAYKDPGNHMVVVTHQALRDDVTDMVAQHLGVDRAKVVEGMTGYDGEGNKAQGWTREETDQHVGDALRKAGAEKLLDFLAVDEGHTALNRAGKQDSHLARVVDSLGRISKHAGFMTGTPCKNDACLHPDTPISDPVTGLTMSVKEWADRGMAPHVWALNEATGEPEIAKASVPWIKSKSRPMFDVTVGDDAVTVAADHKFLTPQGWRHLSDLQPGDLVAVAPLGARQRLSCAPRSSPPSPSQRAQGAPRAPDALLPPACASSPLKSARADAPSPKSYDASPEMPSCPHGQRRSSLSSPQSEGDAHVACLPPTADGASPPRPLGSGAVSTCAPCSTQTTPGSPAGCCADRDPCGGPLPTDEESARGALPSQSGALPPAPACLRAGDPAPGSECSCPRSGDLRPNEGASPWPSDRTEDPACDSTQFLPECSTCELHQELPHGSGLTSLEASSQEPPTLESSHPTERTCSASDTSSVEYRRIGVSSHKSNADIYDLTVPVHHNYLACGIWHHNTEVGDWLAKVAPHKYHEGPGGISRGEFLRRYGSDMPATKAALARELNRYTIMGTVDSGTTPTHHPEKLPPTEAQSRRLGEIEDAYRRARQASHANAVDVDAMKTLSPESFAGIPDEQHHERAQSLSRPLALAGVRDAAYDRAIHLDEKGAKLNRLREIAAGYREQEYPRQPGESDQEHKARVDRGDTTRRAGVVFARQLDAIPKIKAALEADGHEVVDVTGAMSSQEKQKRLDAFKAGKGHILLASDAIEAGSNLQRATWLAHYNIPQTYKGWGQRTARIDRLGQKYANIDVHTLTLDHDSERRKMATMERKQALDSALKDGAAGLLDDSGLSREIREQIARRQEAGAERAA